MPPERLLWQTAPIEAVDAATPRIRSIVLRVGWTRPFRAGQYVDVRLTAPDGYQAQRSYSIASAPTATSRIEIMVERLAGGEVSGFLHDIAEPGDALEVRGPIGLPFSWAPGDGGPLLLVGGGSGVVPLLSMIRHRAQAAPEVPAVLLYSARAMGDVIRANELLARAGEEPGFHLVLALTREAADRPDVFGRRIDAAMIGEVLARLPEAPRKSFVCGSAAFVGSVAERLVDAGLLPASIRTERFG